MPWNPFCDAYTTTSVQGVKVCCSATAPASCCFRCRPQRLFLCGVFISQTRFCLILSEFDTFLPGRGLYRR